MIDTADALTAFAASAAHAPALALDTEFMREKTYRAELCLLQIADGDNAVCIDPLAIADLSGLAPLLGAPGVVKIMHAARQDLEVLLPAVGLVQPVFDTQIAAALAGHPVAGRLRASWSRRLLGVELAKAHTRADWSRRPLSRRGAGIRARRRAPPGRAARKLVRDAGGAGPRRLARGRARGARESRCVARRARRCVEAKSKDCRRSIPRASSSRSRSPPGANAAPTNAIGRAAGSSTTSACAKSCCACRVRPKRCTALPEMQESVVRKCGEELLALVRDAGIADPPPPLPRRERPDPAQLALVKRLADVAAEVAKGLEINSEVLATRRELEKLAAGKRDVSLLRGWRKDVVGEKLASGALTCGATGAPCAAPCALGCASGLPHRAALLRRRLRPLLGRLLRTFRAAGRRFAAACLRRTLRTRASPSLAAGRRLARRVSCEPRPASRASTSSSRCVISSSAPSARTVRSSPASE